MVHARNKTKTKGKQMSITGTIVDHVFIAWMLVLAFTPFFMAWKQ